MIRCKYEHVSMAHVWEHTCACAPVCACAGHTGTSSRARRSRRKIPSMTLKMASAVKISGAPRCSRSGECRLFMCRGQRDCKREPDLEKLIPGASNLGAPPSKSVAHQITASTSRCHVHAFVRRQLRFAT